jgi:uncharacterized cupredoxin-like copper-binding protein
MRNRLAIFALPAAAAALVVAGCGSSGGGSTSAGGSGSTTTSASMNGGNNYGAKAAGGAMRTAARGEVLNLMASPGGQLRFTMSMLTAAHPGTITLLMHNPKSSGLSHGISVEGNGVDRDGPIVKPGMTSTLTVTLKKGTYTYYCPVPGHKQAGMVGKLVVR